MTYLFFAYPRKKGLTKKRIFGKVVPRVITRDQRTRTRRVVFQNIYENVRAIITNQLFWLVVYTNPLRESFVYDQLILNGFDAYLPQTELTRNNIKIIIPLFSRYLFVRYTAELARIRQIRGVTDLIRVCDDPAMIRDSSIIELRSRARHDGIIETEHITPEYPYFVPGEIIRVVYGAHCGVRGKFNKMIKPHKAQIILELLGAQRKVEIPVNAIQLSY